MAKSFGSSFGLLPGPILRTFMSAISCLRFALPIIPNHITESPR
jgi:hypothetical protein